MAGERRMSQKKDTYKYTVESGSRTVYVGVTTDLDRRAKEHRRRWPSATIRKVGLVTTRDQALAWEAKTAKDIGSSTAASVKDTAVSRTPVLSRKKHN
jgi:hypothetical protein